MPLKQTFFTALVALTLFSIGCAQVQAGYRIESVEPAALERIMNGEKGSQLIVIMAAWCVPCITELPGLIDIYDKYGQKGLKIVGISVDYNGPEAMQPIMDKLKVRFPIYWVGNKGISKYGINAIPMMFFIKDGRVVETITGQRTQGFLERRIKDFLE